MKKVLTLICYIVIVGLLFFAAGCEKPETPENPKEETSAVSPKKPAVDPDKPAPLPEGTPKY